MCTVAQCTHDEDFISFVYNFHSQTHFTKTCRKGSFKQENWQLEELVEVAGLGFRDEIRCSGSTYIRNGLFVITKEMKLWNNPNQNKE